MNRFLFFTIAFLGLLASQEVNAQHNKKLKTQPVKYSKNINSPLSSKEFNMLKEVYQDKLDKYVLSRPARLNDFKHLLRNRIVIKKITGDLGSKVKKLSQVSLFDNYNPNLKRDLTFNLETFNPLKYNLEFFRVGSVMYHIDNTEYYIVIKAQNLKK